MSLLDTQSSPVLSDTSVQKLDEKLQMARLLHKVLGQKGSCSIQKSIILAPSVIELLSRLIEDGIDITKVESTFLGGSGVRHIDEIHNVLPEVTKKWRNILKQKGLQYSVQHRFSSQMSPAKFQIDGLQSLKGIEYAECKYLREEALCVLIRARNVLKSPDKTVSIISDNPSLIKMILSLSELWEIEIANCFGIPLQESCKMDFIRLIFETVRQNFPPSHLLGLLRHTMFSFGKADFDLHRLIETLECQYMRGIRKYGDLQSLIDLIYEGQLKIFLWLLQEELKKLIEIMSQKTVSFGTVLKELSNIAIRLSSTEEHLFYSELCKINSEEIMIEPHVFLKLFDSLILNEVFCPEFNDKARAKIFSLIDNQCLEADHMILTGMNEESFFKNRSYDPSIIKGEYENLNVTSYDPDRAKAEKAFISLVGKRNLLITRSAMVDGTPQTPSRLLIKLELLAKKFQEESFYNKDLLHECQSIYTPSEFIVTSLPLPVPPGDNRLQKLSVTQVERLIKDPYSIYATYILKLKRLEEVDKLLDRLDFGQFIHSVIDKFSSHYKLGKDREEYFKEIMNYGQFQAARMIKLPIVKTIWLTQLKNLANWMIKFEGTKRKNNIKIYTETRGELKLALETGSEFTLTCKADRIEILDDGSVTIIDFKTGTIPSKKDILSFASPQLPLEALILLAKGFNEVPFVKDVGELTYISLGTGMNFGNTVSLKENLKTLIEKSRYYLKNLIEFYNKPTTPFLVYPGSEDSTSYNEHSHLERIDV